MIPILKITHLIGSLSKGGAERFVVDLCNELAKDSHCEITLLSLCGNHPGESFLRDLHHTVRYHSFDKGKGFSYKTLQELSTWLSFDKPDIVHSHLNGFEYLILYLMKSSKTLFFHTLHNIASSECPNFLVKAFRKHWYQKRKVQPITVSADGSHSFKNYYRLDSDLMIPNGRTLIKPGASFKHLLYTYRLDSDAFLLVNVARVTPQKNQELLIKAVRLFNSREPKKCQLLIIGGIKDEKLYQDLLELTDSDPQIIFLGEKDNIVDYLALADALCLSSLYEGMPISLIEAFSQGCIPVCSPVQGLREMIQHQHNGFLSKDESIESYYEAIKEALYHPHKTGIRYQCKQTFWLHYHIRIAAHHYRSCYHQKIHQALIRQHSRIIPQNQN
ncbi:glycosyltransferase [Pedobacter gandavensis]|uniref:glycosyltransferase n=1 Tax=Pedobacter gandavensis TaxID=2679963 RepID=UPI00292CB813|nr:glycosyltransferase [Pedobacter gandavensis]